MEIRVDGGKQINQQAIFQTAEKQKPKVAVEQNGESPTNELLEKMIKELQEVRKSHATQLKFEFHEGLQEYFISIVDSSTQEVLKEIPPKKLLDLYAAIQKNLGIAVDQKI